MKYKNFKITRTQIRTTKRVSTTELLAESKKKALEIIENSIKQENTIGCYSPQTERKITEQDILISVDESLEVYEIE